MESVKHLVLTNILDGSNNAKYKFKCA